MQSSQAEFRAHVVDCVFFLFAAVFAWSEIAILRFLISGRRPTLKGYLIGIGGFAICWFLSYLPIWEKFHAKRRSIRVSNVVASTAVPATSSTGAQNQPDVATEQIASVLGEANQLPV